MAEYIDREVAKAKIREKFKFVPARIEINEVLNSIPAADVRPVVLCRDCRHRDPEDHKCDCGQLERAGCVFPVDDNYWCAHGEKWEES